MKKQLEIEKRLLLKRVPPIDYDDKQVIRQFYGPSGRFREVLSGPHGNIITYFVTKKTPVSKGVSMEEEREISRKEFSDALKKCKKHIKKTRYIKKVGKYKWEVDVFDFELVIAEIEVKTKKELKTVKIPKFIQKEIIADVTGDKRFSNLSLSDNYE